MTAEAKENAAAAAAQAAGEEFADRRAAESERLMETSPQVDTSQASWDGPAAVTWPKQSQ